MNEVEICQADIYGGQTIATWKAPKASDKFDAKAFHDAHPESKGVHAPNTGSKTLPVEITKISLPTQH